MKCPYSGIPALNAVERSIDVKGVVIQHSQVSQIFSLPGTSYTAVICERCSYTEFYNLPVKRIKEAFDFSPGQDLDSDIGQVDGAAGGNACCFCSQPAGADMNRRKPALQPGQSLQA